MNKPIYFYRATEPKYGWLSNFYRSDFETESPFGEIPLHWRTVEHFYQANKFKKHTEFYKVYSCQNSWSTTNIIYGVGYTRE